MEEKKMKRTLAFLLVLVMALCLFAGCAKKQAEVTLPAPVAAASDLEFDNDSNAADVAAAKKDLAEVLPKVKVGSVYYFHVDWIIVSGIGMTVKTPSVSE